MAILQIVTSCYTLDLLGSPYEVPLCCSGSVGGSKCPSCQSPRNDLQASARPENGRCSHHGLATAAATCHSQVPTRAGRKFKTLGTQLGTRHMGVSINGGTPIAGWCIMGNPIKIRMISGYPHIRKPPYLNLKLPWNFQSWIHLFGPQKSSNFHCQVAEAVEHHIDAVSALFLVRHTDAKWLTCDDQQT